MTGDLRKTCVVCGAVYQAKRDRALYCSNRCRSAARRERIYAARAADSRALSPATKAKLEQLRSRLPLTAALLDQQLAETDAQQLERSIAAVLAALVEVGKVMNGKHLPGHQAQTQT